MAWGLFNKVKKGFKKVGSAFKKGVNWVNDKIVKPFKPLIKTAVNAFVPGGGAVVDIASDGIDSNGQNIPIQIKGNPKYTGKYDTYYNVTADCTVHPPPPQIWLCRDTFWLASTRGLKYVGFGTPSDKQIAQ